MSTKSSFIGEKMLAPYSFLGWNSFYGYDFSLRHDDTIANLKANV